MSEDFWTGATVAYASVALHAAVNGGSASFGAVSVLCAVCGFMWRRAAL